MGKALSVPRYLGLGARASRPDQWSRAAKGSLNGFKVRPRVLSRTVSGRGGSVGPGHLGITAGVTDPAQHIKQIEATRGGRTRMSPRSRGISAKLEDAPREAPATGSKSVAPSPEAESAPSMYKSSEYVRSMYKEASARLTWH